MNQDWKKELKDYIANNCDTPYRNLWITPDSKVITTKELCKIVIEELTIKEDK